MVFVTLLLLAIKEGERDSLMDVRPDQMNANYGAIQRDDFDADLEFGFEDIRVYLEDWDAPDFFIQVIVFSYSVDLTAVFKTSYLFLYISHFRLFIRGSSSLLQLV